MSTNPESLIVKELLLYLELRKIYAWKNKTQGTYDPKIKGYRKDPMLLKGVADIIGILPDGKFLAIEVKTKTGRVSQHQRIFIENVKKNNGVAFVARSIEDVYKHLKPYFNLKWTYI